MYSTSRSKNMRYNRKLSEIYNMFRPLTFYCFGRVLCDAYYSWCSLRTGGTKQDYVIITSSSAPSTHATGLYI
jgi:hypothetical protein